MLKAVHMHSVDTCYSLLICAGSQEVARQCSPTPGLTQDEQLPGAHTQVEQSSPPAGQRPTKRRRPSTASHLQRTASHTQLMMELTASNSPTHQWDLPLFSGLSLELSGTLFPSVMHVSQLAELNE